MTHRRGNPWFVLAAWLLAAAAAVGQSVLPAEQQALVLMRSLAYDHELKSRAGPRVDVAVLYLEGNARSEAMGASTTKALEPLMRLPLQGLPIVVTRIPFRGAADLEARVKAGGIDTLYVCEGLDAHLGDIVAVTRKARVLSLAGAPGYLEKGLSLGVFETGGKPTIFVNITSSKQEGAVFSGALLKLARRVGE